MATTLPGPPRAPDETTKKWFDESVVVPAAFSDLLVNYSHIPPSEVDKHVIELRDRAWQIHPYPCLGQFRFLELNLSERGALYARLLATLRAGGRFLDIGCCLGQDIRKLVHDGAPRGSAAGAELNAGFIEIGYELFRDRETFGAPIVQANILEPVDAEGAPLAQFLGQLDVVQLGMILHLFTWAEQVAAFENAIKLLNNGVKGTLIIGQASGNLDGVATGGAWGRQTFKHNVETFEKLVKEVGSRTGTEWNVRAELDNGLSIYDGKRTWDDPKTRRLLFEVERV
ncbi:Methyltransferase [Pleurostoma richardsiae]|uniref:Methyltransferase n=1 Tax=Pleurostoma richardsiae TaxID=41990 RepID=A0AA38VJA3_9PEZI|nr:Methyltransferase [Pleurostoma richardsiae]